MHLGQSAWFASWYQYISISFNSDCFLSVMAVMASDFVAFITGSSAVLANEPCRRIPAHVTWVSQVALIIGKALQKATFPLSSIWPAERPKPGVRICYTQIATFSTLASATEEGSCETRVACRWGPGRLAICSNQKRTPACNELLPTNIYMNNPTEPRPEKLQHSIIAEVRPRPHHRSQLLWSMGHLPSRPLHLVFRSQYEVGTPAVVFGYRKKNITQLCSPVRVNHFSKSM